MFDIGFQELIIIFIVALLVFGPERLPEVGRTFGRWMVELRKGIHNAKVQMESEFDELERRETAEKRGEGDEAAAPDRNDGPEGEGKA